MNNLYMNELEFSPIDTIKCKNKNYYLKGKLFAE